MENKNLIDINTIGSFIENDKTYYYIEIEDFPSESLSEKMEFKIHNYISNFKTHPGGPVVGLSLSTLIIVL